MSLQRIDFDARDLEHPVPLERATALLQELDTRSYLYMRHRKNPIPLLQLARNRGFATLSHEAEDGTWHILISGSHAYELGSLLDV